MGRTTPYTTRGIKRVPCLRCGGASKYQWNICALGNNYYGLCSKCDVDLNATVLEFMRVPQWQALAASYRRKVEEEI